ncbi:MAG TPA: peptidyl-prolyl cis-trans isomerase [Candidatus Eisenbacteria bacterium]|nr:peptidyl-prolyl cis-trans isomerase [Candidatus Eisenbacteria bacterium]
MIPTRAMLLGRTAAILVFALVAQRPAAAGVVNRIVATVDGDPITAHEVQRYGEERRAHGVSDQDLLEAVVTDKILEKEIVARKISVKAEDITHYVDEVMARNKLSEEQFKAALKQQNMTIEQYRAKVKEELEKTVLLQQEMRGSTITISDEDVETYYQQHKEEFATRSGVVVRDIFFGFKAGMTQQDAVRVVEQAKAVKQMADSGQSFEALARRYSEGPGADNGGLLGTFKKGEMSPMLERVAFSLRSGEVSEPVVTPNGIHLLKVEGIQGGGPVPFDQVKDTIKQMLYNAKADERFRQWISKNLRDRHHVEVLN